MKRLHLRLIILGLGITANTISYAACKPAANNSKAVCRSLTYEDIEQCKKNAEKGLENTSQGAGGLQNKHSYMELIHVGCDARGNKELKVCDRDCPNP